ncbi:2-oxoglutarate dehydrogenase E1 component [Neobacillus sp. MM2021_6]|uniref:2-oxoglutarate dehydrogenase E1 component n=1 Tax=Bacillaceae TaxID=186817 RepID=UPI00140A60EB|nr:MULTISPECIES: 2-oxoglutarate dehydrogenase E1 component [Bacillaceae]MBO0958361.1 2-oxoglutarate dehydrogenase E1 component [Neobacillus sp. MM2021_6]NHC17961.1 2-oxoglutarate dehydrogenase E1 component [Bacillus sp. MM2020_4]
MNRKYLEKGDFLNNFSGPNLGYLVDQFERYKQEPLSVEEEMRVLFEKMNEADFSIFANTVSKEGSDFGRTITSDSTQQRKLIAAVKLADNIRTYGHLAANIYPLGNHKPDPTRFELGNYGLSEEDLNTLPAEILCSNSDLATGLDAYRFLRDVYTKSIAYEFDHVHAVEEKNWLIEKIETGRMSPGTSKDKRIKTLKRLYEVEEFERFLHKTFVGQKRFSIEGLDVMVPILDEIISDAITNGAEYLNIGMAHRGRLNVLAHVLGKPYEMIFAEFQHAPNKELVPSEGSIGINFGWTGDVKYHLGLNRQLSAENAVEAKKISLANNPSHLEYVGAVVEGFTRAAQDDKNNPGYPMENSKSALAILIHGDAAFPGEGIVAETLNLSRLKGYRTGGTIHIIANNTIGFTTESEDSRSTRYASDLAKGFEIPIIHVNADDPDACMKAAFLAAEYRAVFQKDFLIDLVGYRRYGHNEMDEPMTTSPQMYTLIQRHPTVKEIYTKNLQNEGMVSEKDVAGMEKEIHEKLEAAFRKVSQISKDGEIKVPEPPVFMNQDASIVTNVPLEKLQKINKELLDWPKDFNVFNKLEKILNRRADALNENGKVDWALAETLAFATILADGTPIRLSGQDSERGTFAQRNLVLHDSKTGEAFLPLHLLSDGKASFAVYNSPLTEAAVVGFEYGYTVFSPDTLVIWEAQYGDFANAAQVIFDQFIAAGMAKWGQKSGLVLLLPHGYEGQGPEHSSGRMERFLQSAAEKNWTIANLSSAAQYFHILRRQAAMLMKKEVRPLIIMAPKSLLRNPMVSSSGTELSEGEFKPVLEQFTTDRDQEKIERLVLCSGKIAIDIAEQVKDDSQFDWLQVLRLEEIYPFPTTIIHEIVGRYKNLKEIFWVQEEPKNMGAWNFVEPRLNGIARDGIRVEFVGRRRRSSPAEGEPNVHKLGQSKILHAALSRNEQGGVNNG